MKRVRTCFVMVTMILTWIACTSLLTQAQEPSEPRDATASFHAVMTVDAEELVAGETAIYQVNYTIDQGEIKTGDYVVVRMDSRYVEKARFTVSPQHFKEVEELGNGEYRLHFNENAMTALSGSFSITVTVKNGTNSPQELTTVIGEATKTITVIPAEDHGPIGPNPYGIRKDSVDPAMIYKGYDYSQDYVHQIGVYDNTKEQEVSFRLLINERMEQCNHISVSDSLPSGMTFLGIEKIVAGVYTRRRATFGS